MRLAHHLLRHPSGMWHFRLVVPADLRAAFGLRVIKRSLHTRDPDVARAYAYAWGARYAEMFAAARGGDAMVDWLKKLTVPGLQDALYGEPKPAQRQKTEGRKVEEFTVDVTRGRYTTNGTKEDAEALTAFLKALPGHQQATTPIPAMPVAPRPLASLTMQQAIDKSATYNEGTVKDDKARRARLKALGEFRDFVSSKPLPGETRTAKVRLRDIERTDCADWCSSLLAKRWRARDKKTGLEVDKQLARGTVANKLLWLTLFFDWAASAGHYPKGDNPARGHITVPKKFKKARAKSHGWRAFTQQEVSAIFEPRALGSMRSTSARWLALMSLYTGARSNELARLELEDFREEDGLQVYKMTLEGEDKALKTEASWRLVPIHPDLLALGLVERVKGLRAEQETKLFPELTFDAQNGPANAGQRAFSRLLSERLKIIGRGQARVGLHSFRDTAIATMKRAGVAEEFRREYTGHEQSNGGAHADSYGEDFSPRALAEACFPALDFGLDLAGLRPLLHEVVEEEFA